MGSKESRISHIRFLVLATYSRLPSGCRNLSPISTCCMFPSEEHFLQEILGVPERVMGVSHWLSHRKGYLENIFLGRKRKNG